MATKSNRLIRTTKFELDSIKESHPEIHAEVSRLFTEFNRYKASLVEEYRKVAEAIADLDISKAMATKSLGKLLREAGEAIPMVKVEPQWWVFADKDGKIVLETAFTERDARNATRAQKAGLSRELQAEDGRDLFEQNDEDDDEKPHKLGF